VSSLALEGGRVVGARVGRRLITAGAVVLATGGYAALWGRTTNAPESRGSGLALAWRAGASLADLEFVQFHPTALDLPGRPAFLLSEALRGEGARLLDVHGNEVVDPLLPRDVVARALHRHLRRQGRVFLSLQHLAPQRVYARFGQLAVRLRDDFGLDLARDALPVAPAAHYCMGGIRTDTWARTDVPGLYAAGEVACSGVQGANRLASNSLLECLVFGSRAAEAALRDTRHAAATWTTTGLAAPARYARSSSGLDPIQVLDAGELGARLDADLGVERRADRLQRLVADFADPRVARSNDLLLTSLIASAALLRRESRGAHFRADAPNPAPAWRGRIHWRRAHAPAFEEVLP
jgi:L-aspartate oxidase